MRVHARALRVLLLALSLLACDWSTASTAWAEEGEVTGLVVSEAGAPVAGATVTAKPGNDEPAPGVVVPDVASTKTDATGRFRLAPLTLGTRYAVSAQSTDTSIGHTHRAIAWSHTSPERELVLAMRKARSVRGRILDAPKSGRAYIMAASGDWEHEFMGYRGPEFGIGWRTTWVACAPDGSFTLPPTPRGSFFLRCVAPEVDEITVLASHSKASLQLEFRKPNGASLYGRVLSPKGPVADALVRVACRPNGDRHQTQVAYARTGADGQYELGGLHEGEVETITADAPGMVQGMNGPRFWSHLALRAGERTQADVRVHVTSRVSGVVRSADGVALPGTRVKAYLEGDGPWQFETRETITDANGRYEFEGLSPCRGQVRPDLKGYVWNKRTPDPANRPGYRDGGGTCFLLRKGGSTVALDFVLDHLSRSQLRKPLRGKAVDEEGNPVPGVRVRLSPNRWASNETTPYPEPVITDEAGRFHFAGVSTDRGWSIHGESEEMIEARSVHNVKLGTDEVYVLRMRPKSRTAGRVLDEAGKPVAGVDVDVTTVPYGFWKGQWGRPFVMRTKTDAEGRFAFREANEGSDPAMSVHGWQIQHLDMRSGAFGETVPGRNVTLESDIVLRVRRIPSLELEGRVVDATGAPAKWKRLSFEVIDSSGRQRMTRPAPGVLAREAWSATTDDRGWFRIWRASGDAGASAFVCHELVDAHPVLKPGVQGDVLHLKPAKALPKKHRVEGQLLDHAGKPVPLAWVSADDVPPMRVVNGTFEVEVELHEFKRSWRCERPLNQEGEPRQDLAVQHSFAFRADLSEARLELERAEQRRGRVVDAEGRPIAGVVVDVYPRDPTWFRSGPDEGECLGEWTITDKDGRFQIGRLDGSDFVLRVFPQVPGAKAQEHAPTHEDTPVLVKIGKKPKK